MTDQTSRKEIEQAAMIDFLQIASKVVLAREVECHDATGAWITVECDPPAVLRVKPYETPQIFEDALKWGDDENIDPRYEVSALESHPSFVGQVPAWIYGTSRGLDGSVQHARFVLADEAVQERYKDAPVLSDAEVADPGAHGPRP